MTQNSNNQKFTNLSDGFDIAGGTTARKLTVSGGDVAVAGTGSAVITFPSATSTLATLAGTETLTNKTIDGVTPTTMGYLDATSSIQTQLDAKEGTITLTTTGTSGAATFSGGTLNIPQYAGTTYTAGTGLSLSAGAFSIDSTVATLTGSQTLTNKDLSSGTNTFPTFNQNTTGSAAKLTTARTINGTSFDGTANITITAAGSTLTGTSLASGIVSSSLTSLGTIATGVWHGTAIADTYISSASTWNAKVGTSTTDTLTNKNLTSGTNTFPTFNQDTTGKSAKTDALNSATTTVNVASATAPTIGQVLTATDSTHATWQDPSGGGGATAKMLILQPQFGMFEGGVVNNYIGTGNTTAWVGQIAILAPIVANKITIQVGTVYTTGIYKLALFSDDGQTKYFEVTTASISSAGIYSTTLSSVSLSPGMYYIMSLPQGTASSAMYSWNTSDSSPSMSSMWSSVSGKNITEGHFTVTANTVPSTFDPTAITWQIKNTVFARLDN